MATPEKSEQNHIRVNPDPNTVYRPSLHRVKCQGLFHVQRSDASDTSSVLCKGIQSRFETIHEYPPMKPADALQSFQRSTYVLEDDNDFHHDLIKNGTKQKLPLVIDPKWNELMDTMKEHTNFKIDSLEKDFDSNSKFYGTSSCYFLSLKPYHDLNQYMDTQQKNIQQSYEIVKQKNDHALRSYRTIKGGSILTDIDEDSQNQKNQSNSHTKSIIYAIAPKNEFGVAKRLVHNKDEGLSCSSTTIKLGVLEIHIASFQENDENIESHNGNRSPSDITESSIESQTFKKPSKLEITNFLKRFDMMSNKIQNHMYKNALLVKEELENDFLNRTLKGAKAVTLRMKKTASDIIHFFDQR